MTKPSSWALSVLIGLVAVAPASATPIMSYSIATAGCFNCTVAGPFSDNIDPTAPENLGFTGSTSSGTTDLLGIADDIELGFLSRGYVTSSGLTNFILQVTFQVPGGVQDGADEFVAIISANNTSSPQNLEFDNIFRAYTFSGPGGSGSFEFAVTNDPSVPKNSDSIPILGRIQNASFTAPTTEQAPVPEPGSMVLLGTGLLASAGVIRRRFLSVSPKR